MGSGFLLGLGEGVGVGVGVVGRAVGVTGAAALELVGSVLAGGAALVTVPDGALPAVGDRSSVQPATSASNPVVTTRASDRLMARVFPARPKPFPLRAWSNPRGVGRG